MLPLDICLNNLNFTSLVYKKHYPPALKDEVWRLEKIGKDGSFHKRLNKSGILTVEDFLRLVVRDLDVRLGLPLEDLVPPSVDGRVHHQSRSRCRSHREEAGICHVTGPAHLRAGEEPAAELDDVDSHAEVVAQLMRVPHARRRWS